MSISLNSPPDVLMGLWEVNRGGWYPGSWEQEGAAALKEGGMGLLSPIPVGSLPCQCLSSRCPPSTNQDALIAMFFVLFTFSRRMLKTGL